MFSLDSTDTTIAQLPSTEVTDDRNLDEPVQSRSDFTPGASLEDVHSQLDGQSILGAVQSLHSRQSEVRFYFAMGNCIPEPMPTLKSFAIALMFRFKYVTKLSAR